MRGISQTLNSSTALADEQYLQSIQLEGRTDLGRLRRGIRWPRDTGDVQKNFDNVNAFYFNSTKCTIYTTIQHCTGTLAGITGR